MGGDGLSGNVERNHSWFCVCDLETFMMVSSPQMLWCYGGASLSFPHASSQAEMPTEIGDRGTDGWRDEAEREMETRLGKR